MLVFSKKDIPQDPVFPADLEKLGYFINDQDQIRRISNPKLAFKFKISSHDRWNEAHREAMNACIRRIVLSRLETLSLSTLRLPLTAGPQEQHVPILASSNLVTAKRVIVLFGDPQQDLGIWAYRSVGNDSIEKGSIVEFARTALRLRAADENGLAQPVIQKDTALVVANPGQLIWHWGSTTSMSQRSWLALPRQSAVHPPMHMTRRNKIPRNVTWQEHVECVFEDVLAARGHMVSHYAKIDIIGVAEGGLAAVKYLARNWERWRGHISAMALAEPLHSKEFDLAPDSKPSQANDDLDPGSFIEFVSTRCRAYILSGKPVDWPLPGALDYGCNTYSSGEELNEECIIVSAWKRMLAWLDLLHADSTYKEVQVIIEQAVEDDNWDKWAQETTPEAEVSEVLEQDDGKSQ